VVLYKDCFNYAPRIKKRALPGGLSIKIIKILLKTTRIIALIFGPSVQFEKKN